MTTEGAFNLPALSVQTFEEPALHLPPVLCRRPFACLRSTFNGHQTMSFQFVTHQFMKGFGITSAVPDHAPKVNASMRFADDCCGFYRVARWTNGDAGTDDQMGIQIHAGTQFWPTGHVEFAFSPAGPEIKRSMSDFVSGAVADHLRTGADQTFLASSTDGVLQQTFEVCFFKSRCSALQSAE